MSAIPVGPFLCSRMLCNSQFHNLINIIAINRELLSAHQTLNSIMVYRQNKTPEEHKHSLTLSSDFREAFTKTPQ